MTVAARAGSSPRWAVPSPVRQFVPVALFIAVATATVAIVDERPDIARAGDSAAALAGELAAGALLVAAALAAQAWRPRLRFTGPLAAAGIGWLLFEWNSPGAGPAFTAGLVLYAVWPPLLAQAALRGPDERPLGRPAVALLIVAYATSLGMLGLAAAAVCLLGGFSSPGGGRVFFPNAPTAGALGGGGGAGVALGAAGVLGGREK